MSTDAHPRATIADASATQTTAELAEMAAREGMHDLADVHRRAAKGSLKVDLRDGFRIEVARLVMPAGQYEARLYVPKVGARATWKQAGPLIVADSPERVASDLLTAINHGLLPGVEIAGPAAERTHDA